MVWIRTEENKEEFDRDRMMRTLDVVETSLRDAYHRESITQQEIDAVKEGYERSSAQDE